MRTSPGLDLRPPRRHGRRRSGVRLGRRLPGLLVLLLAGAFPGCQGADAPEGGLRAIGQVQGPGASSPLEGREVVVEGVVNAVFQGLGGFFLQSVAGEDDGDPATSDGIFVTGFDGPLQGLAHTGDGSKAPVVAPGRRVRVEGIVAELGPAPPTLTAIRARVVTELEMLGDDAIPVTVIRHTPGSPDDWERLEGMRVRVEAPLTVTGHSGLQRFGELITSFEGRLFQPSELEAPGPELAALASRNAARTLVLDDGSNEQNPAAVPYLAALPDGWPSHEAPLRVGTELGPVTGVVDVRRSGYLLLPLEPLEIRRQAPRPDPPSVAAGEPGLLRIAVLNVENLFNGDGRGGGFPTPRGAQTPELYALQQAKLVATLQAVDADVVALSEVENDGAGPLTAIRQFADALNAAGPVRDWRAVEVAEGPGTDAIRVGLLYRTSRVNPVGPPVWPDHPIFAWGSRPPLAQAFARPDGEPWLVVANHLKSKGGCPEAGHPNAAPGDADQGDGQACWNAHRVTAAGAMADWLDTDPAGLGTGNALIVGDLNSYGREDPIRLLEARGWRDAFALAGHDRPYSYVFQGQAGRLDHVLIPGTRADRLRDAVIWHANADEFTGFGYEYDPVPTVWRSSDHDLLLLVLRP